MPRHRWRDRHRNHTVLLGTCRALLIGINTMEDLLNFDDIVGGATTLSDAAAYSVPAYILDQLDQHAVILTSQFAYNDEYSHD